MTRSKQHPRPSWGLKHTALAAAILLFSSGVVSAVLMNQKPPVEEATGCRTDIPINTHWVMIVDTTDPLTMVQQQRLRASINDARDAIPDHGKLTILFIDSGQPFAPRELISRCNPGSGRFSNPLWKSTDKMRLEWQRRFAGPIDEALAFLLTAPSSKRSPIIEGLLTIGQRPDFGPSVPDRRITIVSDMIQHDGEGYSHYLRGRKMDLWRSYEGSALARMERPDFRGTSVTIDYLVRPEQTQFQGERHRAFWRRLLTEIYSARDVRFLGVRDAGA